jgi:hypothetical protein
MKSFKNLKRNKKSKVKKKIINSYMKLPDYLQKDTEIIFNGFSSIGIKDMMPLIHNKSRIVEIMMKFIFSEYCTLEERDLYFNFLISEYNEIIRHIFEIRCKKYDNEPFIYYLSKKNELDKYFNNCLAEHLTLNRLNKFDEKEMELLFNLNPEPDIFAKIICKWGIERWTETIIDVPAKYESRDVGGDTGYYGGGETVYFPNYQDFLVEPAKTHEEPRVEYKIDEIFKLFFRISSLIDIKIILLKIEKLSKELYLKIIENKEYEKLTK